MPDAMRIRSLAIATLLLVTTLLVAAIGSGAHAAGEPVGYVAAVEGSAVIRRAQAELPAVAGAIVNDDDRLLTRAASRLLVVLDTGGRIVVGPDSTIALEILMASGRTDGRIVRILQGIMRIGVDGDDADALRTVSPTAIAAARSTEWTMEFTDGNTAVLALEGIVAVTGQANGATVLLEPGFGTDVPAGGAPSEPTPWGEARAEDARMRTMLGQP